MGILDPDGFAAARCCSTPELARRAFEALPTPLRFEDRVGYAYRIAVANIAEEVTNVAVRHGVDPRDFTLVAYGAAGPMLLAGGARPAAGAARRRPTPPGPLLGARPAQHRPRLLQQPQLLRRPHARRRAGDRRGVRADGSATPGVDPGGGRGDRAPELRRAADGTELGDAVRRASGGADRRGDDRRRWSRSSTSSTSGGTAIASSSCPCRASPTACS